MKTLGIDIGGSGIKGALVDIRSGALVSKRHRIPTPQPATPEAVASVVTELAEHFQWLGHIGCTLPARIKKGVAYTDTNIEDAWLGANAKKLFRSRTGCKVKVLNDADAAGIAEMAFGAGKGHKGVVLMLTIGTGIGSALFTKGKLVPNTEFGHFYLKGKNAELHASDRTRKLENLTWEEWAERFQEYLDHAEFLLAPDLIILGGGISRPKKAGLVLSRIKTHAKLIPAVLENEAGIVGAAYYARKK